MLIGPFWVVVEFAAKTHVGYPLARFVVILMGCVHVLFCVWFLYVLALGFAECWLDV